MLALVTLKLSTRTDPLSSFSEPINAFMRVVFPAPDGPTMLTNSPRFMLKLTSSSTTFFPYRLVMLEKRIIWCV